MFLLTDILVKSILLFSRLRGRAADLNDEEYTAANEEVDMTPIMTSAYDRRRQNLKSNPDRFTEHKEKDKAKSKQYRASLSGAQKENYRLKAKLRMREYRAKRKELPKPKLSAHQKAKLRKKWREAKRRERVATTPEQKKEKKKRSLQRQLNALSADEVKELLTHTTPRKKASLEATGFLTSKETVAKNKIARNILSRLQARLAALKGKNDNQSLLKVRVLVGHLSRKSSVRSTNLLKSLERHKIRGVLGLTSKRWKKLSMLPEEQEMMGRKKRNTAITENVKKSIEEFYTDNSDPLPLKKLASRAVLSTTIKKLHSSYLQQPAHTGVSLDAFRRRRPKHVLTVDRQKFIGCLCEYCLNLDFKVKYCVIFS